MQWDSRCPIGCPLYGSPKYDEDGYNQAGFHKNTGRNRDGLAFAEVYPLVPTPPFEIMDEILDELDGAMRIMWGHVNAEEQQYVRQAIAAIDDFDEQADIVEHFLIMKIESGDISRPELPENETAGDDGDESDDSENEVEEDENENADNFETMNEYLGEEHGY